MEFENSVEFKDKEGSVRFAVALFFRKKNDFEEIKNLASNLNFEIALKMERKYVWGYNTSIGSDHLIGFSACSRNAALKFIKEMNILMKEKGFNSVFNHTRIICENQYSIYYCLSLEENNSNFELFQFMDDEKWENTHEYDFSFPYPEDDDTRLILAGNKTRRDQYVTLEREFKYYRDNSLLKGEVYTKKIKFANDESFEILFDSFLCDEMISRKK